MIVSKKNKVYEKLVIIGNGPSVRISDLMSLVGTPCIAVNRFHLSYDSHDLRPIATFCIDPQVIDAHICEILPSCKSPLFIPRQFALKAIRHVGVKAYKIHYFPFDRGDEPLRFSHDISRFSGNGAGVIYSAIQYAVTIGVKEIFLYGLDHHFEINHIGMDGMVVDNGEQNHFIQGYRKASSKWYPPQIEVIEAGFSLARKEGEKTGVKIWNATRGGRLEIFERIEFEDALQKLEY